MKKLALRKERMFFPFSPKSPLSESKRRALYKPSKMKFKTPSTTPQINNLNLWDFWRVLIISFLINSSFLSMLLVYFGTKNSSE